MIHLILAVVVSCLVSPAKAEDAERALLGFSLIEAPVSARPFEPFPYERFQKAFESLNAALRRFDDAEGSWLLVGFASSPDRPGEIRDDGITVDRATVTLAISSIDDPLAEKDARHFFLTLKNLKLLLTSRGNTFDDKKLALGPANLGDRGLVVEFKEIVVFGGGGGVRMDTVVIKISLSCRLFKDRLICAADSPTVSFEGKVRRSSRSYLLFSRAGAKQGLPGVPNSEFVAPR